MEYPLTFIVFLIFFLFILSGFFSCAEAAFFSLNHLHLHKMEEERSSFLTFVRRLLRQPRRLFITIIAGNEAVNISISALITSVFIYLMAEQGHLTAIIITTPLMLVFAEAIPKAFGAAHPIIYSSFLAPFLEIFYRLLRPVVWFLDKVSGIFISLFPARVRESERKISEDEFRELIDVGQKEGALEDVQRDLIHRVFLMNDQPVAEIMIPRVDMFCLPAALSLMEMTREIIRRRHSFVPVYGSDRDNILGILPAGALLPGNKEREHVSLQDLLLKPYFIPLEMSVGNLLRDFRTRGIQMAIVVDEYGGVSGMVTLEDIVEILLSDAYDEHGLRDGLKKQVDDNTWLVSGKLSVDELSEITGLNIPSEEAETVGGFVFHLLGKAPLKGDEIDYGPYLFRVEQLRRARIVKVRITRKEAVTNG